MSSQISQGDLLAQHADRRSKCEVWTRVMGYHRPVSQFNLGKQSEHYERSHFSESCSVGSPHGC
ncbi:MAG: anaerobic ribonucleoside-triphosphate reductase [bacterium]|nr:anaerobic ribonucleoside-triphosphate reductase [bacterium]